MSVLVGVLSVLMGFILGLLGGGGSILTVPILVYVAEQDANAAIATSLLVVGITSGISTLSHARLGNVRFKTGLIFGLVASVGSYVGGRLAIYFSGTVLLVLFSIMMLIAGAAMIRRKKSPANDESDEEPQERPFKPVRVIIEGFTIGAITGLVGAGGGFIVVPALVLLGGLGMRAAVGTSLFVISLKSIAGLVGHLSHAEINLELALFVTALAVVGALLGTRTSAKVRPASLKRGFGYFVLIMAVFMIAKETSII